MSGIGELRQLRRPQPTQAERLARAQEAHAHVTQALTVTEPPLHPIEVRQLRSALAHWEKIIDEVVLDDNVL